MDKSAARRRWAGMEALILLVGGSAALSLTGLALWISGMGHRNVGESWGRMVPGFIMFVVLGISSLVFGIMWGATYFGSYNEVQQLRAFHNETLSAYQYTVDRTESVVIDTTRTRNGSITDFSYQQQGQSVSQRIKEMRDGISFYNAKLYNLLGKNRLPLIGAMYKDVPEDLKPIRLGSVP